LDLLSYVKGLSAHLKESKKLASPTNDTPNAVINNSIASIMLDLSKSIDKVVLDEEIRQSNCPYCHEPFRELPTVESNMHLQINKIGADYYLAAFFDEVKLNSNLEQSYDAVLTVINNCPCCGRTLERGVTK